MSNINALKREAELRAENDRLRELYESAVGNRERFGWTINHLLECEEALRCAEQETARLHAELAKQEAVMVAADRVREAYEAMIEGRDLGRLPDWTGDAGYARLSTLEILLAALCVLAGIAAIIINGIGLANYLGG